jgi:hypothetical protein
VALAADPLKLHPKAIREASMAPQVQDYPTTETDYLPHVIARCVEKANRDGLPYRFHLNGAEVIVRPGKTAEEVHEEVQRQWQAARTPPPAASPRSRKLANAVRT